MALAGSQVTYGLRKDAARSQSCGSSAPIHTIASLIEAAKLNDVETLSYLTDTLTKIVNGHPNSQLDDLLPWAHAVRSKIKAVA